MKIFKSAAVLSALVLATACAQQEEVMVETPQQTPIYAKDGTIIGMEPMVRPGGMMSSNSTMSMDDCMGAVAGGDDTACEEVNNDLPGGVDG
jgi:hypothetical protein